MVVIRSKVMVGREKYRSPAPGEPLHHFRLIGGVQMPRKCFTQRKQLSAYDD